MSKPLFSFLSERGCDDIQFDFVWNSLCLSLSDVIVTFFSDVIMNAK